MLDYAKIHENPPEVQDPVSGNFFPASFSDIKAQKQAEKESKDAERSEIQSISLLTSLFK